MSDTPSPVGPMDAKLEALLWDQDRVPGRTVELAEARVLAAIARAIPEHQEVSATTYGRIERLLGAVRGRIQKMGDAVYDVFADRRDLISLEKITARIEEASAAMHADVKKLCQNGVDDETVRLVNETVAAATEAFGVLDLADDAVIDALADVPTGKNTIAAHVFFSAKEEEKQKTKADDTKSADTTKDSTKTPAATTVETKEIPKLKTEWSDEELLSSRPLSGARVCTIAPEMRKARWEDTVHAIVLDIRLGIVSYPANAGDDLAEMQATIRKAKPIAVQAIEKNLREYDMFNANDSTAIEEKFLRTLPDHIAKEINQLMAQSAKAVNPSMTNYGMEEDQAKTIRAHVQGFVDYLLERSKAVEYGPFARFAGPDDASLLLVTGSAPQRTEYGKVDDNAARWQADLRRYIEEEGVVLDANARFWMHKLREHIDRAGTKQHAKYFGKIFTVADLERHLEEAVRALAEWKAEDCPPDIARRMLNAALRDNLSLLRKRFVEHLYAHRTSGVELPKEEETALEAILSKPVSIAHLFDASGKLLPSSSQEKKETGPSIERGEIERMVGDAFERMKNSHIGKRERLTLQALHWKVRAKIDALPTRIESYVPIAEALWPATLWAASQTHIAGTSPQTNKIQVTKPPFVHLFSQSMDALHSQLQAPFGTLCIDRNEFGNTCGDNTESIADLYGKLRTHDPDAFRSTANAFSDQTHSLVCSLPSQLDKRSAELYFAEFELQLQPMLACAPTAINPQAFRSALNELRAGEKKVFDELFVDAKPATHFTNGADSILDETNAASPDYQKSLLFRVELEYLMEQCLGRLKENGDEFPLERKGKAMLQAAKNNVMQALGKCPLQLKSYEDILPLIEVYLEVCNMMTDFRDKRDVTGTWVYRMVAQETSWAIQNARFRFDVPFMHTHAMGELSRRLKNEIGLKDLVKAATAKFPEEQARQYKNRRVEMASLCGYDSFMIDLNDHWKDLFAGMNDAKSAGADPDKIQKVFDCTKRINELMQQELAGKHDLKRQITEAHNPSSIESNLILDCLATIHKDVIGTDMPAPSERDIACYVTATATAFTMWSQSPDIVVKQKSFHEMEMLAAHTAIGFHDGSMYAPGFIDQERWGPGTVEKDRAITALRAVATGASTLLHSFGKGLLSEYELIPQSLVNNSRECFPASATPMQYACIVRGLFEGAMDVVKKTKGMEHSTDRTLANRFATEFLREVMKEEEPQETADEDAEDDEASLTRDEALESFARNAPKPLNADDALTQPWVDMMRDAIAGLPERIESYAALAPVIAAYTEWPGSVFESIDGAKKMDDVLDGYKHIIRHIAASFGGMLDDWRKPFAVPTVSSDVFLKESRRFDQAMGDRVHDDLAAGDLYFQSAEYRKIITPVNDANRARNLFFLAATPSAVDRQFVVAHSRTSIRCMNRTYAQAHLFHNVPTAISEWEQALYARHYDQLLQDILTIIPETPAPLSRDKVSAIFDEFEPKPFNEIDGLTPVWIDSMKRRISELPDRIESYADLRTLLEHHCSYSGLLFDRGMKAGADANHFDHVRKVIKHATVAFDRMLDAWRKPFDVPVVTRDAFVRAHDNAVARRGDHAAKELATFNHPHLPTMARLLDESFQKTCLCGSLLRAGVPQNVDPEFVRAHVTKCGSVAHQLYNKDFTLGKVPLEIIQWFNELFTHNTDMTLQDMCKLFPETPGTLKRDAIVAEFQAAVPQLDDEFSKQFVEIWKDSMLGTIGKLPDSIAGYDDLKTIYKDHFDMAMKTIEQCIQNDSPPSHVDGLLGIVKKLTSTLESLYDTWRKQFNVESMHIEFLRQKQEVITTKRVGEVQAYLTGLIENENERKVISDVLTRVNDFQSRRNDFIKGSTFVNIDRTTAIAGMQIIESSTVQFYRQMFALHPNTRPALVQKVLSNARESYAQLTAAIDELFPKPAEAPKPAPNANGKKKKPAKIVVGASTLLLETPAGTPKNPITAAGLKNLINRIQKKVAGFGEDVLVWRAHARAAVDKACGKDDNATPHYAAILSGFGWAIDQATNDELKATLTRELLAWRAETEGIVERTTKTAPDAPSGEAPSNEAPAPRSPLDATLDALEVPVDPAARARHLARTASTILCHGVESAANRRKLTPDELAAIERSMAGIVEELEKTTCTANDREALNAAILHAARSTGSADVVAIVQETLATPELEDLLLEHHPTEHFEPTAVVEIIRTREQHVRNEEQDMRIAGELPTKQRNVAAMRKRIATVEKNLAERARNAATPQQRAEAAEQLRDLEQTLQGLLSLYPEYDAD